MQKTTVNILGTEYDLYTGAKEAEFPGLEAASSFVLLTDKIIVISAQARRESKEIEARCIRHELIHAFLYESGLDDNSTWAGNEEMVDWLALQMPKIRAAEESLLQPVQKDTPAYITEAKAQPILPVAEPESTPEPKPERKQECLFDDDEKEVVAPPVKKNRDKPSLAERMEARTNMWKQGWTDDEIAEAQGVTKAAICGWRLRQGLAVNREGTQERWNLYKRGWQDDRIAAVQGVTSQAIQLWRKSNCLPRNKSANKPKTMGKVMLMDSVPAEVATKMKGCKS